MTEPLGWWTISGEALLAALHRVAAGDNPDLVYAELYANSEHDQPTLGVCTYAMGELPGSCPTCTGR